jgi:hypothetical protein
MNGYLNVVKLLLDKKANPNALNGLGESPFDKGLLFLLKEFS